MIAVIDYKAGNLTSVVKALNFLGAETLVTQDPGLVRGAEKVVLLNGRSASKLSESGPTTSRVASPVTRPLGIVKSI